ncbi:MAG: HoxN/HupN/NixA family nickel/cobalt transporter [Bacillota bacterium]|nr:HoxN/HupN/NixA family nickel/cobalt transporter [Bacillota bacterium]
MNNFKNSKKPRDLSGWLVYVFAVVTIHIIGFILLMMGARIYPEMIGMAFISYTLGLRHAFDADHIAAIDNTVRKLIQQKENPKGVGFFFSLGHSTVVILMTVATIFAVHWVQSSLPHFQKYGGAIALTVSGLFLLVIGIGNLYIWAGILKQFIEMRKGVYKDENNDYTISGGVLSRIIGIFYKYIKKSWHVYVLGFMFGLGFDTATQVALLTTSAGAAGHSVPAISILAFPILFAAGMSLMDTADGFFMTTAYEWVFSTPLRKVYYNLTITGLSVIAALFIGFVEVMQMLTNIVGLNNRYFAWIKALNFNDAGYILVMLFILVWLISFTGWKLLKMDENKDF